eukprot:sb/3464166/
MLSCRPSEDLPLFASLLEKLSNVIGEDGISLSLEREMKGSTAVLAREREAFLKAKFIENTVEEVALGDRCVRDAVAASKLYHMKQDDLGGIEREQYRGNCDRDVIKRLVLPEVDKRVIDYCSKLREFSAISPSSLSEKIRYMEGKVCERRTSEVEKERRTEELSYLGASATRLHAVIGNLEANIVAETYTMETVDALKVIHSDLEQARISLEKEAVNTKHRVDAYLNLGEEFIPPTMSQQQDLPFAAEYAKSGRAACKTCGGAIPKDHIRIAKMVQSPHFDGKVPLWNHFNCFFRKQAIKSTGDIKGFGTLRFEDQTKIKEKVGGLVKTGKGGQVVSKEVQAEYAKSNRSTCHGCYTSIAKDTLRVGCWVDAEGSELKWAVNGKKQSWHHPSCFADRRKELGHEGVGADVVDDKDETESVRERVREICKLPVKSDPDLVTRSGERVLVTKSGWSLNQEHNNNFLHRGKFIQSLNRGATKLGVTKSGSDCI